MLLLGTSGPFGKYIALPVALTIEIRALLAFLLLFAFCGYKGISFSLAGKDKFPILICGLLMGVHWVSYFYALQLSNVAVGMLSLFTYPVITAFLEPFFLRSKLQKLHLILGIMVLTGIYLLVPDFGFQNSDTRAIALGVFSAICYSVRNLVLKTKVDRYNGSLLMTYQMGIVGLLLIPAYFFYGTSDLTTYWKPLLGLILITTVLGHTMFINCFKHFSVTTVSILSSIQPVYGILIGAFILSEIPSLTTIFGGILILSSVVIESFRSYK